MIERKTNIAKAGSLICVDSGEYSSYAVTGFFVVLRDFDPMLELDEYLNSRPKQREGHKFIEWEFLAALLKKGLLLEIEYSTLYLGDYRGADAVTFKPFHIDPSERR